MFLLGEMPIEDARAYVDGIAETADEVLTRYQEIRDTVPWDGGAGDFYARAALEYGLRSAAMEADWARWLIAEIDRRSS